ncbi:hypothetical protein [Kluyvera georgiana]|uniref:hypothetical protein n=1 Tax=Kluyvera georgiana TaxID=73098 RepID=UPI000806F33B|nr:hypothetical protein [Kluyvera georgiana]
MTNKTILNTIKKVGNVISHVIALRKTYLIIGTVGTFIIKLLDDDTVAVEHADNFEQFIHGLENVVCTILDCN